MLTPFYNDFDTCVVTGASGPGRQEGEHRSAFQLDRDRVVFSYAFRRLQSKTQVFHSGEYDFYRTRLTHSLEVARIARSINDWLVSRADNPLPEGHAIDGDLLEVVGLSHDLGHPPFGHIGERKLNELMADFGGFEGNAQTLRILTSLIYERREGPRGMLPSRALLDGIMKYKALWSERGGVRKNAYATPAEPPASLPANKFLYDDQESFRDFVFGGISDLPAQFDDWKQLNELKSIECQIMDWADDTAYSLHDIVDGVKAGFLTHESVTRWAENRGDTDGDEQRWIDRLLDAVAEEKLEAVISLRIGDFIRACSLQAQENFLSALSQRHAWHLHIDPLVRAECALYKELAFEVIFRSSLIQQLEYKGGYLLERLFEALAEHYLNDRRPKYTRLKLVPELVHGWLTDERNRDVQTRARLLCDYLASLTDHQAHRLYKRLFDPDFGSINDLP